MRPFAPFVAALACAVLSAQEDLLLHAGTVVLAPDTVVTDTELLLRKGQVAFVGKEIPEQARRGARRASWPDGHLVPGLVNVYGWLGHDKDLAEASVAATPALRAADAFDPWHPQLRELVRNGVSSHALAPSARNVIGGIAALVKPGRELGRVADDNLYLATSLGTLARNRERYPTSLMGAADLMRQSITSATGPTPGPDLAPLREAVQGQRRWFLFANTREEIRLALSLVPAGGAAPVIVGGEKAGDCIAELAAHRAAVALAPLGFDATAEQLALPAALERANVLFAFAGDPGQLRISAALAVRHGCSRKAALAALTRTPAELLGLGNRVGSLRQGCDGDVAVFGGDPLDLTAPLLALYVDGELLTPAAGKEKNP